jgi:predicted HicB family RNase H-like nuclease
MDLTPYVEGLQRDLAASAAPGGPEIAHAAEMLTGSLEASARLCLLEALSEAAAEITTKLRTATVDVRLRGREADFTVTEINHEVDEPAATPATPVDVGGELARITLRLPEALKEQAERAAAGEGISVNAWLVRAVAAAVATGRPNPPAPGPTVVRTSRRLTGFAQA